VKSLVAVVGPSMGGFPVLPVGGVLSWIHEGHRRVRDRAAGAKPPGRLEALQKRLASDPNWNGGWYYENGGIPGTLEQIRYETLLNYGQGEAEAKGGRGRLGQDLRWPFRW